MNLAKSENQFSGLSSILLSNIEETIFFGNLAKFIVKNFDVDNVRIFEVFEDGSNNLIAVNGNKLKNIDSNNDGLANYVSKTRRAYYSNTIKRDPMAASLMGNKEVESVLAVPVIIEDKVIATIHLERNSIEQSFGESDISSLQNILNSIQLPLTNMKLYMLAKHLNKKLLERIEQEKSITSSTSIIREKRDIEKVDIIAHNSKMLQILESLPRIAKEDFPVLIQGSLGTGKRLLARKIHNLSSRAQEAYQIIDCKLEETALLTELFGKNDQAGALERVNNGTILFQDIENLTPMLQGRILKSLLTGQIERIDSSIKRDINVRVISTSRVCLKELVEAGRFSEDLMFRLNTARLRVPALCERKEDIKLIAEHYVNLGRSSQDCKVLTASAIEVLSTYSWPGNIQELRNIIERTYALTEGKFIDAADLPEEIFTKQEVEVIAEEPVAYQELTIYELERQHIVRTLDHLEGNKTKAAKALGITVKTLYNKLHSYGLVKIRQ